MNHDAVQQNSSLNRPTIEGLLIFKGINHARTNKQQLASLKLNGMLEALEEQLRQPPIFYRVQLFSST
jgi:hypothetical protein